MIKDQVKKRKMLKKSDQLVTELENLKKDLESDKGERASVGAGIQEDIESTKADLRKLFVKLEEKNSEQEERATEFIKICKYIERAGARDGKKDERAKKKSIETEETQDELTEKLMEFQRKNRCWLRLPKSDSKTNTVESANTISQSQNVQISKLLDSISQSLKPSIKLTETTPLKEKTEFMNQCQKYFDHHEETIRQA